MLKSYDESKRKAGFLFTLFHIMIVSHSHSSIESSPCFHNFVTPCFFVTIKSTESIIYTYSRASCIMQESFAELKN